MPYYDHYTTMNILMYIHGCNQKIYSTQFCHTVKIKEKWHNKERYPLIHNLFTTRVWEHNKKVAVRHYPAFWTTPKKIYVSGCTTKKDMNF